MLHLQNRKATANHLLFPNVRKIWVAEGKKVFPFPSTVQVLLLFFLLFDFYFPVFLIDDCYPGIDFKIFFTDYIIFCIHFLLLFLNLEFCSSKYAVKAFLFISEKNNFSCPDGNQIFSVWLLMYQPLLCVNMQMHQCAYLTLQILLPFFPLPVLPEKP